MPGSLLLISPANSRLGFVIERVVAPNRNLTACIVARIPVDKSPFRLERFVDAKGCYRQEASRYQLKCLSDTRRRSVVASAFIESNPVRLLIIRRSLRNFRMRRDTGVMLRGDLARATISAASLRFCFVVMPQDDLSIPPAPDSISPEWPTVVLRHSGALEHAKVVSVSVGCGRRQRFRRAGGSSSPRIRRERA